MWWFHTNNCRHEHELIGEFVRNTRRIFLEEESICLQTRQNRNWWNFTVNCEPQFVRVRHCDSYLLPIRASLNLFSFLVCELLCTKKVVFKLFQTLENLNLRFATKFSDRLRWLRLFQKPAIYMACRMLTTGYLDGKKFSLLIVSC